MKRTYIIILIFVVLTAGAAFILAMDKKVQMTEEPPGDTPVVSSPMPMPGANGADETVVCTMDAKLCPDGSYVGRTGPNCEFAACPVGVVQPVKEFTVSGKNFSFTPSLITVKKGDKVKITFQNSSGFHDFVIDEYGVAAKQAQSPATEVIEFTADKAGSFEYYCSVGSHRAQGMKGTLVVN